LEDWRKRLEEAGLKVGRAKTEHLPPPGAQGSIRMKQYGLEERTELPKAHPSSTWARHCTRREDVARRLKLESVRPGQSGESSQECSAPSKSRRN